jgi:RNA polymerase sigma-70 factor (ECF subfamily)
MDRPEPADDLPARIAPLQGELLGFLRRRRPQDAEELAQEVWLRVAAASTPSEPAAFRAYVYTVARRLLIDRHRRRRTIGSLVALDGGRSAELATSPSDPHGQAVAAEVLAEVERCLADMKPEVAQVFRWRATTDLSFKDIAERQGCSLNTALGRQHQAAKRIARALHEAGLSRRTP